MEDPVDLKTRLLRCADLWCAATGQSLTRLGVLVCNDGGFFTRVVRPDAGCTTITLEKFARFLGLAEHWPAGDIPEDVVTFVHINGLTAPSAPLSPGSSGDISPRQPAEVNPVSCGAAGAAGAEGVASPLNATPEGPAPHAEAAE